MRLIDADKLIASSFKNDISYNAFVSLIKRQQTIDAESVVRCKDCRWHEAEQPGMVYCPNTVGGWVNELGFCADGERRKD